MPGPNFSESQLQSAVNSALVRNVYEENQVWIMPFVVSLRDEFATGWDSAFSVPWYPAGDPGHNGCNLFIQYKLSDQLTTPQAKQWSHWNQEYFRFKIPHRTKRSGKIVDDFHQWRSLVRLSNAGFAAFYVTNSTLSSRTLNKHYASGVLLERVVWLRVSDITTKHKEVTFTRSSPHCYLHSEVKKIPRISFKEVLSALKATEQSKSLADSNFALIETLNEMPSKDHSYKESIARISELASELREQGASSYIHFLIRNHVHRFFGCNLYWIPTA